MSQYTINGINLEMEDYDFQKRFEEAYENIEKEEKDLQKVGKTSELTKRYCEMFYHLFDMIFGKGTSGQLFDCKYNMAAVDRVYGEFIAICSEQAKQAQNRRNKIACKYKPNRTQRRSRS